MINEIGVCNVLGCCATNCLVCLTLKDSITAVYGINNLMIDYNTVLSKRSAQQLPPPAITCDLKREALEDKDVLVFLALVGGVRPLS